MMLFYKLWALERAAHTLETWHSYSLTDRYGLTEWLHTHTHMLLFSMLILCCFSVQSSSADSWRVGAGPAAPEAVPPGPDEQMAADPTVFCHTSGSGVCLS